MGNSNAKRVDVVKLGAHVFYSVPVTRAFFDELAASKERISVQQKGESAVVVLRIKNTYEHFALGYAEFVYYDKVERVPYTINYRDLMNNEVKLVTKEGKTKQYGI